MTLKLVTKDPYEGLENDMLHCVTHKQYALLEKRPESLFVHHEDGVVEVKVKKFCLEGFGGIDSHFEVHSRKTGKKKLPLSEYQKNYFRNKAAANAMYAVRNCY